MDDNSKENTSEESKKSRNSTYCCVPQCSTYIGGDVSGHYFPKDVDMKKKWQTALRMGKEASSHMRVCSNHFAPEDFFRTRGGIRRKLFPHALPSRNLPIRPLDRKETDQQSAQRIARTERVAIRNSNKTVPLYEVEEEIVVQETQNEDDSDPLDTVDTVDLSGMQWDKATQVNHGDDRKDIPSSAEGRSLADILSESASSTEKAVQANFMNSKNNTCVQNIVDGTSASSEIFTLPDILNTDEKLYTFTGIESLELLTVLTECVSDIAIDAITKKKILPLRHRVVLTMSKIKMNLSFCGLAVLFGISRQTCSNYFKNMCPLLSRVLRVMIPWPTQEFLRNNLPLSFDKYRSTRIVLDCAETAIEKSKCLKCRILTYSHYKKNHTVKFDVGVAPSGLITEMSSAYGGRASDKFIVDDSKILDKLDFKDSVMVDKGFQIEKECLERHLHLIRPPFLRQKKQLSRNEALESADIAKARVHVERVIQRLREYDLVSGPIAWPLAAYFDDVLQIVAGLTNMGPPVMSIDKFM